MSDNKEDVLKRIEAERRLIRDVFDNEKGRQLLQKWAQNHIWAKQLCAEPNELYARIGQQEFVVNILNCIGGEQ